MEENPQKLSILEKLKFLYHSVKLVFFNDEKHIGKHITDELRKPEQFKSYFGYLLDGLFSKDEEIPEIGVGYQVHKFSEEKELQVYAQIKYNWQRTLFGRVREGGCSGSGSTLIYSQPLLNFKGEKIDSRDEEQIIINNLEEIAQEIYDHMPENDDGKSIRYQLYNGCMAYDLSIEPVGEELVKIPLVPIKPLPEESYSQLENKIKKLVKSKAKRSWE